MASERQVLDSPYSVERVKSKAALDGLAADWNRLSEAAEPRNAFTTWGWFTAWMRQDAASKEPWVLVIRRGDTVVGLSPLVRRVMSRAGFSIRKLEFVTHHADYNDLVLGLDRPMLAGMVADYLARSTAEWDLAELRDLRDEGNSIADMESALRQRGLFCRVLHEPEGCPYLPTDGNAAQQIVRLSSHVRSVLRRRVALAEAEGARVRILEEPQKESGLLEKLIALEHEKYLHRKISPLVGLNPETFRELFQTLGASGWLYVALLEIGEQAIAYQLGFRCGGSLWDYSKAHDQAFSRLAPGTLLLAALLDYGFEHGYREYDFLRGEEPYKLAWSVGQHRRMRLVAWNKRGFSRLCALALLKAGSSSRRSRDPEESR